MLSVSPGFNRPAAFCNAALSAPITSAVPDCATVIVRGPAAATFPLRRPHEPDANRATARHTRKFVRMFAVYTEWRHLMASAITHFVVGGALALPALKSTAIRGVLPRWV